MDMAMVIMVDKILYDKGTIKKAIFVKFDPGPYHDRLKKKSEIPSGPGHLLLRPVTPDDDQTTETSDHSPTNPKRNL